jgi:hypothetical protein
LLAPAAALGASQPIQLVTDNSAGQHAAVVSSSIPLVTDHSAGQKGVGISALEVSTVAKSSSAWRNVLFGSLGVAALLGVLLATLSLRTKRALPRDRPATQI